MPDSKKFPVLEYTDDDLADVIRFIKDGNIVVLHTKGSSRIFNTCLTNSSDLELSTKELEDIRVIYVDCNRLPDLLEQGEWEWYIHMSATSAKDNIFYVEDQYLYKNEVGRLLIEQKSIPNREHITL